jgi:hypothetical protein
MVAHVLAVQHARPERRVVLFGWWRPERLTLARPGLGQQPILRQHQHRIGAGELLKRSGR